MSADGCGNSRRPVRVCRILRHDFQMFGAIFVAPLISRYCARPPRNQPDIDDADGRAVTECKLKEIEPKLLDKQNAE